MGPRFAPRLLTLLPGPHTTLITLSGTFAKRRYATRRLDQRTDMHSTQRLSREQEFIQKPGIKQTSESKAYDLFENTVDLRNVHNKCRACSD
jgi:hypothetical protein